MTNRRATSRIARELPPDLRDQLNSRLTDGRYTYDDITEWLGELGFAISRSAVGRYGAGFLARLERLKRSREQARTIVETNNGKPGTEMVEAAHLLAVDLVTEKLLITEDLEGADVVDILNVLAKLEASATKREALKLQHDRGVTAAEKRIQAQLRAELQAHPELAERLSTVVAAAAEEVRKAA